MKKYLILFYFIFIIPLWAYERSMVNLHLPAELKPWRMQFTIQHRFYGRLNDKPFETFFGAQAGANVGLRLRYAFPYSLEASWQKEWLLGISYHKSWKKFGSAQIEAHYMSLKPPYPKTDRESGLFFQLDLKGPFFLKRITPVVNAAYDTYLEKSGVGFGLDLAISKKIALIGEYYPPLNPDNDEKSVTVFGIVFKTYGHHFIIQAANGYQFTTRRLMRGSNEEHFYLGFTIHRLLGS